MRNKKYISLYALGLLMVLGLRGYARLAGTKELYWLLRPTAWWAGVLSKASFAYEPGVGFVNHSLRFIIAPECAGLRFLMIACLMLIWSFVHRMKCFWKGLLWTLFSLPAACAVTVFVNGIRIALAVTLPPLIKETGAFGMLTLGQLHTAIGALVYFLSLLALYRIGDGISRNIAGMEEEQSSSNRFLPALWYLGPVLGLPLLSRMAYGDFEGLAGYELPVLAVCGSVLLVLGMSALFRRCVSGFFLKKRGIFKQYRT